jgi:hypothetical protein
MNTLYNGASLKNVDKVCCMYQPSRFGTTIYLFIYLLKINSQILRNYGGVLYILKIHLNNNNNN